VELALQLIQAAAQVTMEQTEQLLRLVQREQALLTLLTVQPHTALSLAGAELQGTNQEPLVSPQATSPWCPPPQFTPPATSPTLPPKLIMASSLSPTTLQVLQVASLLLPSSPRRTKKNEPEFKVSSPYVPV